MYLVINKCVTAVKVSNFSGHYLRNRSTLDIGIWVISVYFNIRNTLPKSGTFLLGHPDEASFTRDGINNSRNVHTLSHENPHETRVTNFQRSFSVYAWCGVLGNRLIGPFVFDSNLTGNTYEAFLRNELPE